MPLKSTLLLAWILAFLLVSCRPQTPARQTVFAAASLVGAFGEIGRDFEAQHPGMKVSFNFGGSQTLAQQLAQGAPADVFASANPAQMKAAADAGRVDSGAVRIFAKNRLVVIAPKDNPAGIHSLEDLARTGLRLVLAAKEVPAGQYALDFLAKASQGDQLGAGYREAVLKNVASYEENVEAVLSKVSLGEADAGIVYASDAVSNAGSANQVVQIEIPEPLNVIASYPIAVVKNSPAPQAAQDFVDFVLSQPGQAVLQKYGFEGIKN